LNRTIQFVPIYVYKYYCIYCVLFEKIAHSHLGLRHKIEFSNASHIGVDVSSESWKLRMLGVVFFPHKSLEWLLHFIIYIYIFPPSSTTRFYYYYYYIFLSYFSFAGYFNLFHKFVPKDEEGFSYFSTLELLLPAGISSRYKTNINHVKHISRLSVPNVQVFISETRRYHTPISLSLSHQSSHCIKPFF